jgi:hypothetical protein
MFGAARYLDHDFFCCGLPADRLIENGDAKYREAGGRCWVGGTERSGCETSECETEAGRRAVWVMKNGGGASMEVAGEGRERATAQGP